MIRPVGGSTHSVLAIVSGGGGVAVGVGGAGRRRLVGGRVARLVRAAVARLAAAP